MTIQQLQIFLALCEEMNYTRAAAKCYISRQALRQNITVLEEEFHGPLVENAGRTLILTEKGRLLQAEAEPVVAAFRRLEARMLAATDERREIRIGISHSLVPDYLPRLRQHLDQFAALHPRYRILPLQLENDKISELILQGQLECGLVLDMRSAAAGIQRTELTAHSAGVHVSRNHPLAQYRSLRPESLATVEFCLPGTGPEFRPLLSCGIQARVVQSYYQVYYLVREQNAAALNRYYEADFKPGEPSRIIPLEELQLCSAFLNDPGAPHSVEKLRDHLKYAIRKDFS